MIVRQISRNAYLANTYVGIDEETKKAIIVDPGEYRRDYGEFINKNGLVPEYIILTHGHGDHIGGVPEFMRLFPDAKLVASAAEAQMLADPRENASMSLCGSPLSLKADISVREGDTLPLGDSELKFIMTPGHTKGGMCILCGDALFSGDTLFEQSIGRTDFPGGSFAEISDSIKNKLYRLPDDTNVFPGHMGPTTIGYEKRHNPFVRA